MANLDDQPYDDSWHWVLLESGSNQEFIFRSPRRRYSVGASGLLLDVPGWVDAACAGSEDVRRVLTTSSKALLLARTPEAGREVVREATRRAMSEAPGLDFWGVVEQEVPRADDGEPRVLMQRVAGLHQLHAQVRYERPTPHLRARLLPFSATCALTGVAASRIEHTADGRGKVPVSEQAYAALERAKTSHADLSQAWPGHALTDLKDEIDTEGYVAIIHADGNKVGQLITGLANHGDVGLYRRVSQALVAATAEALTNAITATAGDQPKRPWILPLIVGGDDITVIVDAQFALAFAANYLTEFEKATANDPDLAGLAGKVMGRRHLTASAGLVACKASTPFSLVYDLVEAATRAAKAAQDDAPARSLLAFIKTTDSVPEASAGGQTTLMPGPDGSRMLVGRRIGAMVAPSGAGVPDTVWAAAHSAQTFVDAVRTLGGKDSPLSGSRVQALRQELARGELTRSTLHRVQADGVAARAFLDAHLLVRDSDDQAAPGFTRVLDLYEALTLLGKVG